MFHYEGVRPVFYGHFTGTESQARGAPIASFSLLAQRLARARQDGSIFLAEKLGDGKQGLGNGLMIWMTKANGSVIIMASEFHRPGI